MLNLRHCYVLIYLRIFLGEMKSERPFFIISKLKVYCSPAGIHFNIIFSAEAFVYESI